MKMAKFAPIVGIIVVLVLSGITFGEDNAKTPAEAAPVYSDADGTPEGAPQAPSTLAADKGGTDEKKTEDGEEKKGDEKEQKPKSFFEGNYFLPVMIGGFILLWVFMGRNKKKQAAKRRELLTALKKGDRVMTIGGIIGTVAEAREQELVIKVDDGTRMKFARWAIRNAGEEVAEEKQSDTQEK